MKSASIFILALVVSALANAATFEDAVQPVLERRCVVCHGPAAQNADVRLDNLSPDIVGDRRAAETWHDVLNAVNRGEMPPQGAPQLTALERSALVEWLNAEIQEAAKLRRATGGQVVMRRLNHVEYQNTMRDLLGLDIDYVKNLPPDEMSSDGFKNNGAALRMSPLQLEYYLAAARSGLARAIVEGPAPPVFAHQAEETVIDKVKNVNWSNRLGRSGVFAARIPEFPDEGEFVLRVKARAELPAADSPYPHMHVSLGYRADTQTPSRVVAVSDVSSESPQVFEFRGRIEEYPLQSRTQSKYPGLLVWIRNAYTDGRPTPEGRKIELEVDGKREVRWEWDEDPAFPKVVIESVEFQAPVYSRWPKEHHRRLVPQTPASTAEEEPAAEEALRRFLARAYRGPVDDDAHEATMRLFSKVRPTVGSFEEALREAMAMALVSPSFLYRVETPSPGRSVDDYELASRLSYFLWSTMPDARLLDLAARGELSEPQALEAEAARMLDDPRFAAFVEQFSDQWLDLSGVDRIAINPNYYPDFDPTLKAEMRRETQQFFAEILRTNASALSFLRSDFRMLNQRLATHYGIAGPRGGAFERVNLQPSEGPGGLLTQASILLSNSTGEDSHPIERGVWIRKVLLDDPPAPPPPSVPNLDTGDTDAALLPLKRQLELHLDNAACAQCHQDIDPWGVALEGFDAIGRKRQQIVRRSGDREARFPIDAAATLPDGERVDGVEELTAYLTSRRQSDFARALTSKLLTYALGRSLELDDEETIDELTSRFIENEYRLKELVTMIVTSEVFRRG